MSLTISDDEEIPTRSIGISANEDEEDLDETHHLRSANYSYSEEKMGLAQDAIMTANIHGIPGSPIDGPTLKNSSTNLHKLLRRTSNVEYHLPPPPPRSPTRTKAAVSVKYNHEQDLMDDEPVSPELVEIMREVKQSLELRNKYQTMSLQKDWQNPKNRDDWKIYPKPPHRAWNPEAKEFNKEQPEVTVNRDKFDASEIEIPGKCEEFLYEMDDSGVFQVFRKANTDDGEREKLVDIPTLKDYYVDLEKINKASSSGPAKSFAFKRLQYLEAKWNLYVLLNEYQETLASKQNPHRDFYNVRKVDTHVHHSACMNQKHLLRFIKKKIRTNKHDKVIFRDGKVLTLDEVFKSLELTAYDLSIDSLDMHAHKDTFHRFDKFNLKYNPIGESRLREIFLKTDNYINGKFLAEITTEVFQDLEQSKYQMAEYRISIYGRSVDEWEKLAAWVVDNKLVSHNVRWLIQVPRLYDIYKRNNQVESFKDIVINLFKPLFEATVNPEKYPKIHIFLQRVIGFDSVDDESKIDRRIHKKYPNASDWKSDQNPPYNYYLYYLYANMSSLNHLRAKRNMNTFVLRPHSGEAGDPEHLCSAFLVAEGISHGILLRKVPFVQYLYYLDQIGVAMSPLSNNALFLTYDKNPFPYYFKRGLNISLSTDDPLQFSYTKEPLIEEYSVAAQIYKLSNVDMCELARNSVLQSGFEQQLKKSWISENVGAPGVSGNDIEKTNVPDIRMAYREDTLRNEHALINRYTSV